MQFWDKNKTHPSCQPIQEICQRIKSLNKKSVRLRILLHTDAAQALGKIRVDASELGMDYLTIVGHKVRNLLYDLSWFGITEKTRKHLIDWVGYISSSTPLGSVPCMWMALEQEHRYIQCCLEEDRRETSDPGKILHCLTWGMMNNKPNINETMAPVRESSNFFPLEYYSTENTPMIAGLGKVIFLFY